MAERYQEGGLEISESEFGSPRDSYQLYFLEMGQWVKHPLLTLV